MRYSLIALLAALVFLSAPAAAQATPEVKGYGGAEWGMTPAQVIAVEPRAAQGTYKIEIDGNSFSVSFLFNGLISNKFKIYERYIHPEDDLSAGSLFAVKLYASSDKAYCDDIRFPGLEKSLTEKYGTPTYRDIKKMDRTVTWTLPKTSIELNYNAFDASIIGKGCPASYYITYEMPKVNKNL